MRGNALVRSARSQQRAVELALHAQGAGQRGTHHMRDSAAASTKTWRGSRNALWRCGWLTGQPYVVGVGGA